MKALQLSLLFIVFSSVTASAQWLVGANVKVYDPVGAFDENVNATPVGLSLSGHHRGKGRLSWGGEIGVAMYTNDQYNYDLAAHGAPGQTLRVDEEDCFWTVHGVVRYEGFSTPSVRQYVEFRLGATTFFSSIIAAEEHNTVFRDQFSVHGTALNTAIGTGFSFNPGGVFSGGENISSWWIDIGVNAHSGTESDYRNFKTADQGILNNGNHSSLTNYIDYRVGVLFEI